MGLDQNEASKGYSVGMREPYSSKLSKGGLMERKRFLGRTIVVLSCCAILGILSYVFGSRFIVEYNYSPCLAYSILPVGVCLACGLARFVSWCLKRPTWPGGQYS